ncbi:DUF5682 family protein [Actinopolymorpha pittospori]
MTTPTMSRLSADQVGAVTVLGVRHHGPGTARALRAALADLRPDVVLIEGPPEADALVPLAADPEMEPPVALLAYVPGEPNRSAFWPFASFSPEWQAIQYALNAGIPVRFCDLPAANVLATPRHTGRRRRGSAEAGVRIDPLGWLAETAGYDDAERWWDDVIEHRRDGEPAPFAAIAEAMTALREHAPAQPAGEQEGEARREAYMRTVLRRTLADGYTRIAVVCGAWHVPALLDLPTAAADNRVLKGRTKTKVAMTWVPWTHSRLAYWSGYGAGVESPGWYHHLFETTDRPIERWLTETARILRDNGLPVSSAHVIEGVRLAETLASLRGRPLPGLAEVTEATRAVLCEGADLPVELVQRKLVVGERLGRVPAATPMVPLQQDLRAAQRRLRLKPEALDRDLDLDLRKPTDLERSRLLHRLRLLDVDWGEPGEITGSRGTFHELWTLAWRPELDLALIEASMWGNTVADAAIARATANARDAASLSELSALTEHCLLADLPDALPAVLTAVGERAALDGDVTHLMAALPALVRSVRYGDVRGTDVGSLRAVIAEIVVRMCVDLPPAIAALDEDAERELLEHIEAVHSAVNLLADREHRQRWETTLAGIATRDDLPGLIEGRLVRLLLDAERLDTDAAGVRMARAVSVGAAPAHVAAWVEGFLSGGGLLLVHDDRLLHLIDAWLAGLPADTFDDVLPLLRRTFGTFDAPERRAIGDRMRRHTSDPHAGDQRTNGPEYDDLDHARAEPAVRAVAGILGLTGRQP